MNTQLCRQREIAASVAGAALAGSVITYRELRRAHDASPSTAVSTVGHGAVAAVVGALFGAFATRHTAWATSGASLVAGVYCLHWYLSGLASRR